MLTHAEQATIAALFDFQYTMYDINRQLTLCCGCGAKEGRDICNYSCPWRQARTVLEQHGKGRG